MRPGAAVGLCYVGYCVRFSKRRRWNALAAHRFASYFLRFLLRCASIRSCPSCRLSSRWEGSGL